MRAKHEKFDADAHWRSLMARMNALERARNPAAVPWPTGKEALQSGGNASGSFRKVGTREQEREFHRKANKKLFAWLRRTPTESALLAMALLLLCGCACGPRHDALVQWEYDTNCLHAASLVPDGATAWWSECASAFYSALKSMYSSPLMSPWFA